MGTATKVRSPTIERDGGRMMVGGRKAGTVNNGDGKGQPRKDRIGSEPVQKFIKKKERKDYYPVRIGSHASGPGTIISHQLTIP